MTISIPRVYEDTIPHELKARPQWVLWRYEERDGKQTKVPYNARAAHSMAQSNNPATWSTFANAFSTMLKNDFDGIGYVFSQDDPYCGIDLDKAIKADGTLEEWAADVLDTLDSYAEVSPSGTGLHIFVKAHLAHQGNRRGKVEIYDAGRYFTMTGCRWHDSPSLISERQNALENVHQKYIAPKPTQPPSSPVTISVPLDMDDHALIELAKSASNGAKFTQLWNGSAVGYESDSEADSALVCSLLFWCQGDTKRVDSLFRQSGRMRDKWDTRHARDGRTYGDITLENAAKTVTKYYTPKSIKIATPEELPTVQVNPHEKRDRSTFCGLPSEAISVYQHLQSDTASWLSDYVDFAKSASPMTPAAFHQAAALFAVSTIIARRLCLKVSTEEIFPNLFILFLARSTLYSKTTGFKIIETLFREAGLNHHLLPQRMTPEAMVQELSLNLPNGLNLSDTESRLSWLRERAFASQRGWMIDEAHSLLDGMKRDFNVGLMAMLLKMYDCPAHTVEQTVGRGRVTVKNGYLSFFGATTPASAADHLTNSLLWQNGIWARFAIITHDDEPTFQFFPSAMELPRRLINRLRDMAELFPTPRAELTDMEDIDGSKRKVVELLNVVAPASARLEDGVWQAWETYTRFIRHDLLITGRVDDDFYGIYGRMGTLVMKVAMILAVMDTQQLPVTITLAHYALAQSIVEEWRESLHRLRDHVLSTTENTERDKVLDLVVRAGDDGILLRDIYRPLNMPAKKVKERLEELQEAGQVELFEGYASNGRKVQMARSSAQQQNVA